mgnify:CR=1 FL=1
MDGAEEEDRPAGGLVVPADHEVDDELAEYAPGARGETPDDAEIEEDQLARVVDDRQPLALVLAQQEGRVLLGDADRRGDQRHGLDGAACRL